MELHTLRLADQEARVTSFGAELLALRLRGREVLWQGGSLWPKHAPLLFPIVGSLPGGTYRHGGRTHALPRHGFARDREFTWLTRTETECSLELREDAGTLEGYPFPFRLRVRYTLSTAGLTMDLWLANPGSSPLPASLGLHPAFRWPLVDDVEKAAHWLAFTPDGPGPAHRLDSQGLLKAEPQTCPLQAGRLALEEGLFAEDALVFLSPRCNEVRYGTTEGPVLRLDWQGFPHLGLWAKTDPGPSFLCIEPWAGHAAPVGWEGALQDKPGTLRVGPGATHHAQLTVALEAQA